MEPTTLLLTSIVLALAIHFLCLPVYFRISTGYWLPSRLALWKSDIQFKETNARLVMENKHALLDAHRTFEIQRLSLENQVYERDTQISFLKLEVARLNEDNKKLTETIMEKL